MTFPVWEFFTLIGSIKLDPSAVFREELCFMFGIDVCEFTGN